MSIKLIAIELYRAQQKVNQLEEELNLAPESKKDSLRDTLRQAKAEWQQLRNMLDGRKAAASIVPTPRNPYGR